MTRRSSWAVAASPTVGLVTVEDARLSVGALWTPTGQITSRTGLVPAASEPGRVTATSPTPNGFVHVAPFRAVLQSNRGGGTYVLCSDAVEDINILSTPANPSNPRIDLIVWQQNDTYFGNADSQMLVRHIVGTPAGVPVDPVVSGSTDYVIRARVTVPAGTTDIEQADIANVPLPWTVATGGVLPMRNQTERDAISAASAAYEGMFVYRIDRDWNEFWDGAAWRVDGVAICTSVADRNSAITNPRSGQLAQTTDTDTLWQYDGATSAWLQIGGVKAPRGTFGLVQGTADVPFSSETLVDSMTFSHVQGRYEKFRLTARFSLNAGGVAIMRFRYVAGAGPVTTAHSMGYETIPSGSGSNGNMNVEKILYPTFRALASGTYTVGVFAAAAAGATSGTINGGAAGIERDFEGSDTGAP